MPTAHSETVESQAVETQAVLTEKHGRLQAIVHSYQRVLVAFSGGADSAFILKVARDILGKENVLAAIAKSPSLPEVELAEARKIAREIDSELLEIETHELDDPRYAANPLTRCFFCKTELYSHLLPTARERGFLHILNGTNQDDLSDWRPGLKAAKQHGIKSPLLEAGLTKSEIRQLSRELGLSTWSKPQAACLSSRIPLGVTITSERLKQVEEGEKILKQLGFKTVRLRWFGTRTSIEVGKEETGIFFQNSQARERTLAGLKGIGFQQIDLTLQGYRSGRFNPSSK